MTPRLTIVMPLKGRQLFTLRFLWHANRLRLPFHFLIADGQVDEAIARVLEDSRNVFPDIEVEYIRYPDDLDYGRYFSKMFDAMQRVRTPYVMHADNDDFLGFDGIAKAIEFLDSNKDYVCARGRIVNFSVYSGFGASHAGVSGSFNRLYMHPDSKDVIAQTAGERIREGGLRSGLYYGIYRTEAPVRIWEEVTRINFSDLMLHESFYVLRALTLGKAHTCQEVVSYYSQSGTGISYQPMRDWASHLLRSRFTSEAHAAIECIAAAAAEGDSARTPAIAEDVTKILENHYRRFLSGNYGWPAEIKRFVRKKWPRFAAYAQTRPRLFLGRERAEILAQLIGAGASRDGLDRVRGELALVESALSPHTLADLARRALPAAYAESAA